MHYADYGIKEIDDLQRKYDSQVNGILQELDLKDEAKRRMIDEVYQEARGKYKFLVDEQIQKAENEVRKRRMDALAPRLDGAKDTATLMTLWRDARDRVKDIRDANSLERVLQEAEMAVDEVMVVAILMKAYELQSSKIVGKVLEPRVELRQKYDAWMDALERLNELRGAQQMWGAGSRLRKPEEYIG